MTPLLQATLEPDPGKRHIDNARVAATFLGLLGLLLALLGRVTDFVPVRFGLLTLIETGIMFAFAYGFARRSRVASVLCICYLLLGFLVNWQVRGRMEAVVSLLLFGYFFVRGTIAVFRTHAHAAEPTLGSSL